MPCPSTPPEIIDQIIDILAHDDPLLLSTKACALVSHEFLQISRKYIFASIALNYDGWPPFADKERPGENQIPITEATTAMLQRLLDTSPEIGQHIRYLCYYNFQDDCDLKNTSFLRTFKRLTNLKVLLVSGLWTAGTTARGDAISSTILHHLLRLPTLVHLKLVSVDGFIFEDLELCVNLECLDLEVVLVSESPNSPNRDQFLPKIPIRLRKITIGMVCTRAITSICAARCADGKPFINFNEVTDLSIKVDEIRDVTRQVFSQCKQLVNARISVNHLSTDFTQTGLHDLLQPSLQTLKRLHLDMQIEHPDRVELHNHAYNDTLYDIPYQLEEIRTKNIIETISFTLGFLRETDVVRRSDDFSRLDECLARSGWSQLLFVAVTINVVNVHSRKEVQGLSHRFEANFPKLTSSKNVSFKFDLL